MQTRIPIPYKAPLDPYHKFLHCPKCKERKLVETLVDPDKREGKAKRTRTTLVCAGCKYDFQKMG